MKLLKIRPTYEKTENNFSYKQTGIAHSEVDFTGDNMRTFRA